MPIPVTEAQDEELTGEVQLAVELDPEAEERKACLCAQTRKWRFSTGKRKN